MEKRLVPVNSVVGLATADGLSPSVLAERGFEVAGLEVPLHTTAGNVLIDVVLVNPNTGHLIVCEAKSGDNIEVEQAQRYAAIEPRSLIRNAFIDLRVRVEPTVEAVYVGIAEHSERLLMGLRQLDPSFPLIVVHPELIALENGDCGSEILREALGSPVPLEAPPAQIIPFDHDSEDSLIEPSVRAALVAALTHKTRMVSIRQLTEQVAPHYVLYGAKAQTRLRRKVADIVRRVAADDPATYQYHGVVKNRDAYVNLLRTPEEHDPRGRTQGYQRLARAGRRRPTRSRHAEIPGQGSLLDELEKADTEDNSVEAEELEAEDTQ